MRLREKQALFVRLVGMLIEYAYEQGYELTFGEAYRTPEQAALNAASGAGISSSLHSDRLAIDFNLFRDGRFLADSVAHKPLGDYWKSLHSECRWGGDFKNAKGEPKPDGNHYSIENAGRK
jgi:hypothetical protein